MDTTDDNILLALYTLYMTGTSYLIKETKKLIEKK